MYQIFLPNFFHANFCQKKKLIFSIKFENNYILIFHSFATPKGGETFSTPLVLSVLNEQGIVIQIFGHEEKKRKE